MKKMQNDRPDRTRPGTCTARQNAYGRRSLYNDMREGAMLYKDGFGERLAELRMRKQVSAREMSLSLGQGAGYINNIENGHNLPSMSMFFEICEYLGVEPGEFFGRGPGNEGPEELEELAGSLDRETLRLLAELVRALRKE